jgi:predicted RNA-binding Zn ribbon-like protein
MQHKKFSERYNRFRFDAGCLALNFVATVRHRGSTPRDLLSSPEALNRWFLQSGLSSEQVIISVKDLKNAVRLREAIHDVVHALITSAKPDENDVILINRFARHTIPVIQLSPDACDIHLDNPYTVMSCLALIARDAVEHLGSTDKHRIKMCGNDTCRMLFLDISPANRRRWCAMSICGNRAKVALHRKRHTEVLHELF